MASDVTKAKSTLTTIDNQRRREVLISEKPQFFLHLDADRDGTVDENPRHLDTWTWGKKGRGAVVMVNNSADHKNNVLNNEDSKIGGPQDAANVAPLDVRCVGPKAPSGWSLSLSVNPDHKDNLRIFNGRIEGSTEIIGPSTGPTFVFPSLDFDKHEFGMEALRYAGQGFDGLIELTLRLSRGTETIREQKAMVRVAPWIMFNHLDMPEEVFVINIVGEHSNSEFVTPLKQLVSKANLLLNEIPDKSDRWAQDIMEFGYSQLPGAPAIRVVMETPRGRELAGMPKRLASSKLGYFKPADVPKESSSLNSGGNLECTPPFVGPNGKKYPFGRIYTCEKRADRPADRLAPGYAEFLAAQIVQAPFSVDAGWLAVGHVDEIVSFIPAQTKLGFKLLVASPGTGMSILKKSASAGAKLLVGKEYVEGVIGEMTVSTFIEKGINWKHADSNRYDESYIMKFSEIEAFNKFCQEKISGVEQSFRKAMGLTDSDIAYVPSIYVHSITQPTQTKRADALTAGMVNMLVLGKRCIAPNPFGPTIGKTDLFAEHFRATLAKESLELDFIDDWSTYHTLQGEVHCGTNTLRKADSPVRWWEYEQ